MSNLNGKYEATEKRILSLLQMATDLKLSLSEDEATYHTSYVSKKIAECSSYMEKLSDMQMELTKISLEITKLTGVAKASLRTDKEFHQASKEFTQLPALGRPLWLRQKMGEKLDTVEKLDSLAETIAEVRQAISERLTTFKRLDSDVRLHARVLEGKMGSDATAPMSYASKQVSDLDL